MITLIQELIESAISGGCKAGLERSKLGELAVHVAGSDEEGSLRGVLRFYGPPQTYREGHDDKRERSLDALQAAAEAAGAVLKWPRKESAR